MIQLDLLLVNAPSRTNVYGDLAKLTAIEPPVWAGLIARYCLDLGFSVEILDAEAEGLNVPQTARRITEMDPRLATFCIYGHQPSASTQCLPAASAVAQVVAQWRPLQNIPMLALGTHPSALPERTLREEPFDFVVQGEGPRTVEAVLHALKNAGHKPILPEVQFAGIPGLWYRGAAFRSLGGASNTTNLDQELPSQAWELLDMKSHRAHNWHIWSGDPNGGYASIQTSLNCPFSCSFCCISAPFGDRKMRFWSPSNVAAQIANLVNNFKVTNIKVADEMFCLNRQHVTQICNMLIDMKLGDRLNIWAYARVDTVKDEQMLERMRRAGFRWLGIGIESGSQHVRDSVEKGRFGAADIVEAIRRVQSHDLCVAANYIFGLPDDTTETCRATLDLACELNTEMANFYCAMAYPGSPLYQTAKLNGWRLPEDPGGPGWIGYSQHAYDSMPLPTETLTYQEILDIRDQAFLDYFSRPVYLEMMARKFGPRVVAEINAMVAHGKPRRKHRNS